MQLLTQKHLSQYASRTDTYIQQTAASKQACQQLPRENAEESRESGYDKRITDLQI